MREARALRGAFRIAGVVATAAGLHTVIAGTRSIAGQQTANASIESEIRFYAAFYVAYGVIAPRADRDVAAVRALATVLFVAGLARAGGWLAVGRPHRLERVLLLIELGGPPIVIACQRRLALHR